MIDTTTRPEHSDVLADDTPLRPATGPRHPMLRPGVRVVRRDDGHLQVGVRRGTALVIRDTPDNRAILDSLRSAQPVRVATAEARRTWDALLARDQVVDADSFLHHLPPDALAQHGRAALFAQHPSDAPWRLAARQSARVAVDADHHGPETTHLLAAAGINVAAHRPTVMIVIASGEVRRERLDPLVQANTPHLVISESEGTIRVGPFVEPGQTACLRCIDAHLSEEDPRHGLIVAQQAKPADASPVLAPFDESHRLLAVALGIVDIVAYIEGDQPSSWSRTIDIGRAGLPTTLWKRHPWCGCSWGDGLPT